MCDGIFTNYKLENFKTNLKNLLKKGEEKKMNVGRDAAAFANDLAIVGRPATSPRGGAVWHRSEAKRLLEDDVRDGRHRGSISNFSGRNMEMASTRSLGRRNSVSTSTKLSASVEKEAIG